LNYKIGQKVRIKSFEEIERITTLRGRSYYYNGEDNYTIWFHKNMQEYCGKIATIKDIDDDGEEYFLLEKRFHSWNWKGWMFEDPLILMLEDCLDYKKE
jgi:hypothetical protein